MRGGDELEGYEDGRIGLPLELVVAILSTLAKGPPDRGKPVAPEKWCIHSANN